MKNVNSEKVFTSIKLLNGNKCDITEIRASHIFTANYRLSVQKNTEHDFLFFLLKQILLIDEKPISEDQLLNLCIDDFLSISNVLSAILVNIPGFK